MTVAGGLRWTCTETLAAKATNKHPYNGLFIFLFSPCRFDSGQSRDGGTLPHAWQRGVVKACFLPSAACERGCPEGVGEGQTLLCLGLLRLRPGNLGNACQTITHGLGIAACRRAVQDGGKAEHVKNNI